MILSLLTVLVVNFGFTTSCMATQNSGSAAISCVELEGTAQNDAVDPPESTISGNNLIVVCAGGVTDIVQQVTYNTDGRSNVMTITLTCIDDVWQYTPSGTTTAVTVTAIGCDIV